MYITYQVSNLQFIYMYMDKQYIYNDLLVSASEIGRFNKYGRYKRHYRSFSWCPLEHVRVLRTGSLLFLHSGYQNIIEFIKVSIQIKQKCVFTPTIYIIVG